ncbi:polysaccharide biosynthesis protein [Solirubrobacter deserti]|uniref:Polysaccharide biosynthesis protein n=1 Tax=Solirubrobacter deserti TaxID=2282478 RepID=A0ABT4RN33_9ACTN|nr:nucleoside-diphosphate sugar epimerase/dehydratase [Solirubrobacter deserti]MDA0139716.1 polysaccharide biosynthesis protein [Solirubrobacter deserti]
MALDAGLVALAYYLAYWFRFDGEIPARYSDLFWRTLAFAVCGSVLCFVIVGMYRHWMRYSSQREYLKIAEGVVLAVLALIGYVVIVQPVLINSSEGLRPLTVPSGVLLVFGLLTGALLTGTRYAVHFFYVRPITGWRVRRDARSVLIVGAGDGGHLLQNELVKNPELGLRPIGFVDDNKTGRDVFGTTYDLDEVLADYEPDEVMIAIPSAPGELRGRVVSACREHGVPVKTVPTVFELLQGGSHLTRQLREVRVEDVLGRNPVTMEKSVGGYLTGRRVLVTGAGGSIGSELCRQIARVNPSRLVLVDHSEANLFEIERELVDERHVKTTVSVLADVKDEERMREVFAQHQPEVVFHAAAYKHVGLMEANPIEAVRNNALATRTLTEISGEAGVVSFVLISTDKAVAPATVMGASKALAEWAVEAANARFPETAFCAVRFGNVLGSSGSVVPIFRRQIAAGGPVTVTDPEMTRFFMTIPEAVQLVIRSGSLARGGEVYALDMGEPVSIMELAKQMIEFSGLKVGRDIGITIVGRRPGEKLHEQLFNSYETPEPTPAEKIRRAARPSVEPAWVEYVFDKVGLLVAEGDAAALAAAVSEFSTGRTAPAERSGGTAS